VTNDSIDHFLAEYAEVHKMCDKCKVPTTLNGEKLSMLQRVGMLASGYRNLSKCFTAYRIPST